MYGALCEAIASRLEAITSRFQAVAIRFLLLLGWRPLLLGCMEHRVRLRRGAGAVRGFGISLENSMGKHHNRRRSDAEFLQ